MVDTPEKKDRSIQLNPSRFQETEHANTDYTVTVEQDTKIEDVQKPEFWSHVSPRLRPYDKIRVRTDHGMWYAELLVLTASRNWAKVKLLLEVKLQTADVDQTQAAEFDGYKIEHAGPHLLWRVVRASDSATLKDKAKTKTDAELWLREHLKTSEI